MKDDPRDVRIEIQSNGPYVIRGPVPLVSRSPIETEHGEPIAWRSGGEWDTDSTYLLCRCGRSGNKPFCDGTHSVVGFDGTETASTDPIADQQKLYPGTGVEVRDARRLCVHAGFCGNRLTNVWKMVERTDDTQIRALMIAMIERCPSGALSYALSGEDETIEPDLQKRIAPIPDGPLWVTGGIAIHRADGTRVEIRNRVTLCRCGASKNKPFCDGSHSEVGFSAPDGPTSSPGHIAGHDNGDVADSVGSESDVVRSSHSGGEDTDSNVGPLDEAGTSERTGADDSDHRILGDSDGGDTDLGDSDDPGRYMRYMADFIGFTPADGEIVRSTKPIIEKHLPVLMAEFYDQLLRYPPTRRFFLRPDRSVDHEYLELRMRHQISFWRRAADGVLDDEFARYVDFVGKAHTARGADPKIYVAERYVIGMIGFIQHAISRAIMKEMRDHEDQAAAAEAQEAWDKLTMVILEFLSRAYSDEHTAETFEPPIPVDHVAVAAAADRAIAAHQGTPEDAPRREVPVGRAEDIADGDRRIVRVDGRSIGVFHQAGRWYALRNYCLHRGGPVATGRLEGCVLTCPWHGYQYDISTGQCLADATAVLDTYPVIERDGELYLLVPEGSAVTV